MADMTRYEFALVLATNMGLVGEGATGQDAVDALVSEGLTTQTADTFRGNDVITRDEAATLFTRAAGVDEGLEGAVDAGLFTSVGDPDAAFDSGWFTGVFDNGVSAGLFTESGQGVVGLTDLRGTSADEFDWEAVKSYAEFDKTLRERFPAQAWMLDDPELGSIIVKAVNEEWGEEALLSAIAKSEWGLARTDAEEKWDILVGQNPEQAEREVAIQVQEISDTISRFGATVPEGFIDELARDSLRSGMTDGEIIGAIFDATDSFTPGEFTAAQQAIREAGNATMLRVSDDDAADWARRIATGEWTTANVEETLQTRAKSKFPSLAELIDNGTNLSDYFSDHRQAIADMMGLGFEQVDLVGDSRWAPVLGFSEAEGVAPRPMAAHEVERFVRGTNAYYETPQGRAELNANRLQLQSALGLR